MKLHQLFRSVAILCPWLLIQAGAQEAPALSDVHPFWICGTKLPTRSHVGLQSPFPNDPNQFWPNGRIPYLFDSSINATQQQDVLDAMKEWSDGAGVQFVVRGSEDAYIFVTISAKANVSYYEGIGYDGGKKSLFVWPDAWKFHSILLHELGHALGFWHTQSRLDRDGFVRIESNHLQGGEADQFEIKNDTLSYGPYDFASIMHYRAGAFSACTNCTPTDANCRVITVLPPYQTEWQTKIGDPPRLSTMDKLTMSLIYAPSSWRFVDQHSSDDPGRETFFNPYRNFTTGENAVPANGTLIVQAGTYSAGEVSQKARDHQIAARGVTLTQ